MTFREVEHTGVSWASPERLYELIADVTRWPVIFGPCVHAQRLNREGNEEQIELWARTNDEVKSWRSHRLLDPVAHRVHFRQARTAAPVSAMSGEWSFHRQTDGRTKVVLKHKFSAVDDDPSALDWISEAVDRNSVQELNALARVADSGYPVQELVFSFADRYEFVGADPNDAYDFVYRSDLWPHRLPHVGRVDLQENGAGVQVMEMDTVTADGRAHTTKSIRLCFPNQRIIYKQTVLPALMSGHSGRWEFTKGPDSSLVLTSHHMVAVDPEAVAAVLGADAVLADARTYLTDALGANSRTTMAAAVAHAAGQVLR